MVINGLSIIATAALAPAERGIYVATSGSIALGAALGGLSMDTFLLARGAQWLRGVYGSLKMTILASTVPMAGLAAAILAVYSAHSEVLFAVLGAGAMAAANLPAAAAFANGRFAFVYRLRAATSTAIFVSFIVLIAFQSQHAKTWLSVWLTCQVIAATVLWLIDGNLLRSRTMNSKMRSDDIAQLGWTHSGVVAAIFMLRFDQLVLSRFQGPTALAIYSLGVSAVEFAQAGSAVASQRVIGDRDDGAVERMWAGIVRALLFAAPAGLAIIAALAVFGHFREPYHSAWTIAALLLPGSLFLAVGQIFSARLVAIGKMSFTAVISFVVCGISVVSYLILLPRYGAAAAAIISSILYLIHLVITYATLRWTERRRLAQPAEVATRSTSGV
ncbi:lipopolysaccharide biosynthesis protein [Cryptosporangium arvum]|uniref:lipopolysaccharide biosynthesis protein n=1 Tax=Cryptosporangium arvum TaxID=80871 RepID=UPI000559EEE5|nr:hypothetical protein [Cryptosporangium arvum]